MKIRPLQSQCQYSRRCQLIPVSRWMLAGIIGAFAVFQHQDVSAQILYYDFGTVASPTFVPTTVATNATATNFTFGSGLSGGTGAATSTGNPPASAFVRSSVTTEAVSSTSTDYVRFTMTPNAGFELDLTNLRFDYFYSASTAFENATWTVRSNADGFASNLASFQLTGTSSAWTTTPAIDLSGASFQNLTGTIEFRIFLTDNNTSAGSVLRTDNIMLNGAVVAVPEPSVPLMFSAGLGVLICARRRLLRK